MEIHRCTCGILIPYCSFNIFATFIGLRLLHSLVTMSMQDDTFPSYPSILSISLTTVIRSSKYSMSTVQLYFFAYCNALLTDWKDIVLTKCRPEVKWKWYQFLKT